jgi:hypothetical protein
MIWTTSILSCCLLLGATLSASEPPMGIEGVITVGPVNGGPARIGIPGSKPLANATFLAQNEKGIATPFTTDDQGYFRVPLEPGHYIVSLKDKKGNRALWALRSRCSCRPDDEGRVAL